MKYPKNFLAELYDQSKSIKQTVILLIIIFASINNALGQISQGGSPPSFHQVLEIPKTSYTVNVNQSKYVSQDSRNEIDTDIIGERFSVDINPRKSGTWNELANGDRIWQLQIDAEMGDYIMLVFGNFYLPKGSKLFVYSVDKKSILGAFTSKNNSDRRRLTTTPIHSKSIIVEYYESSSCSEEAQLQITSVGILSDLFSDALDRAFGDSQGCMINAMCDAYENWCNQRRSVALMIRLNDDKEEVRHCSGSLLTNERRDGTPYFMTAFHCIDIDLNKILTQAEANAVKDWHFIFNYQSDGCLNPEFEPSLASSISGASFVIGQTNTDYAILQLNHRPPGDYNVFYNGWTNDSTDMTNTGVCIHHPTGDIKKISEWEQVTSSDPDAWKVKWTAGSAEPGSSGSPLFNAHGYVVGVNSESNSKAGCDTDRRNWFGRFDLSWHNYGLNNTLSPNSTASYYVASMIGDETCKENWFFANGNDLHTSSNVSFVTPATIGTRMYDGMYNAVNSITAIDVTIKTNTSVTFEAGEISVLKPGFHAEHGSIFRAGIGSCLRGCGNGRNDTIQETMTIATTQKDMSTINKGYMNELKVYPNPNSSGVFNIELKNALNGEGYRMDILNVLGEIVLENKLLSEAEIIDISEHAKGIYYVRISNNDEVLVKKVLYQ